MNAEKLVELYDVTCALAAAVDPQTHLVIYDDDSGYINIGLYGDDYSSRIYFGPDEPDIREYACEWFFEGES